MNHADLTPRWRQRLERFSQTLRWLGEAVESKPQGAFSGLEQDGVVQRFEFTFELAWKTLKDRYFSRSLAINFLIAASKSQTPPAIPPAP